MKKHNKKIKEKLRKKKRKGWVAKSCAWEGGGRGEGLGWVARCVGLLGGEEGNFDIFKYS